MYKTERIVPAEFQPSRFESDGEIVLRNEKVRYHTVSEDTVFYGDDGKPIASIFSYSYFRKDVEHPEDRPVIFGYNGGPGSSSMYVHAGFLGPKRIVCGEDVNARNALPPYEVIDNPDCLLDVADIVVIDPVGTGYGLLIDPNAAGQFYGIEEDAEALLVFIEKWLHRYNRWLSPKYLVGESYGCTRNAVALGIASTAGKEHSYRIAFDGAVMIGNTVTPGKYFGQDMPVESAVLGFPTYAGVNWYHRHPSDQSVEAFVAEAKAFADTEYQLALYRGASLSGEERAHIIERVCYYTGVSEQYLTDHNLRIDDAGYRSEVLRPMGKSVARYDGRFTRPQYEPREAEEKYGIWDDASSDRFAPYFLSALSGVILPALNVSLDRVYVGSTRMYETWNKKETMGTTAEHLRRAMHRTPGMRTFFANGWFDLCTETGYVYYTMDQAGLPMDRVSLKGYPSGHMIYLGEANVAELCQDIRRFLAGENPTND